MEFASGSFVFKLSIILWNSKTQVIVLFVPNKKFRTNHFQRAEIGLKVLKFVTDKFVIQKLPVFQFSICRHVLEIAIVIEFYHFVSSDIQPFQRRRMESHNITFSSNLSSANICLEKSLLSIIE